jgi:hypothetical protein
MGREKRNACRILLGKPERKRPLERLRCMWVDNIKMGLRAIGWGGKDWIDLVQDRDQWMALVNTVINFGFHKIFENFLVAERLAASQEGLSFMELIRSTTTQETKKDGHSTRLLF